MSRTKLAIFSAIVLVVLAVTARRLLATDARAPRAAAHTEASGAQGQLDKVTAALARTQLELAAIRRDQQAIAADQVALNAKFDQAEAIDPSPAPASESAPEDDEAALQERIAEERVATERRYESLAKDLKTEPRDSGWANGTENSLRARLKEIPAASMTTISSLECRSTLCRAEIEFSSAEGARQFRPPAVDGITRGTFHISETEGNDSRITLYLARGDRSLRPLNKVPTEPPPLGQAEEK